MICIARTFGAPDTVPAGKHDTSASSRSRSSASLPFDDRRQVHHVREALEPHELRHAHRSVLADAADVVAAEIDEHHVLGALLLVALQLLGQPQVLFGVPAARPRAGDRMRLDARAFDAHQHLRRRADDRHAAHADEIHVGRRVHVAQRAVHGERIGRRPRPRTAATARPDRCRRRRCAPWPCGPAPRTARACGSSAGRRRPSPRPAHATGCARARARGTESSRRRTDRATRDRRPP